MVEIRFYNGEYPVLVPDGEYKARCVGFSELKPYKNTQKLFLNFELRSDPWKGEPLYMAFNIPFDGVKPGSKYLKYWTAVNGNRPPSRKANMSPSAFKNKEFKVFTRTVKRKRGPEEMPENFQYSVIDHIAPLDLPDTENESSF